MVRNKQMSGFSLIELLLVLAIIGIMSGIAIPSYMGQRRRARLIGDAQSNAAALRLSLETRKADFLGVGAAGASTTWRASGNVPSASTSLAPDFTPQGNSKLTYTVVVGSTGLSYRLDVKDPARANALTYQTNQNGSNLYSYR